MTQPTGIQTLLTEELRAGFEIQDWTSRLLTQEIYENIGQLLSLAKIQLAAANASAIDDAKQLVRSSDKLLEKAIRDLRKLAKLLTPAGIYEKGFAGALSEEAEKLSKLGLYKILLTTEGIAYRLDPGRELVLFSILQHFILGTLYRGAAELISLNLLYKVNAIHIRISYSERKGEQRPDIPGKEAAIRKRARLIGAAVRKYRSGIRTIVCVTLNRLEQIPNRPGG